MTSRILALYTCSTLLWIALSGSVAAQAENPSSAPSNAAAPSSTEPAELTPEQEGTGVMWLAGELGVLDPDAAFGEYTYAGGISLHAVGGRRNWPVLIGLGGGLLLFDSKSVRGPSIGYTSRDNGVVCCRTTIDRSVEIRHAELLLRVQPFWGFARPYAELAVGIAALWHFNSLHDKFGDTIASRDEQLSVSFLYGGTLGIDLRLYSLGRGPSWTADIVLSIGITRYYTGPMERPRYLADIDQQPVVTKLDAQLALWIPFIAIGISADSRSDTNMPPRTSSP